ncbi:MAG TPA: hypothetical protein VNV61_03400 [Steroidobacteraceae bacterium]|nr:hypothetical protein [Steroidobacteraceae bacterium]
MSVAAFTLFHVILSLIGIASGLIVVLAMLGASRVPALTAIFLATTVATSVTGFMFHFASFGPPEIVGAISLAVLALAILALYSYKLAGAWRRIYVVTAVLALYLNVFVGVVQTFQKVAFFHALAPTQTEPPFAIAQGIVLLAFIALGVAAAKKFRNA